MKEIIMRSVLSAVGLTLCTITLFALADAGSAPPRKRAPGAAFFSDIPEVWPAHVRLRVETSVKLYEKGIEVGAATFNPGTKLKLLKVNPDQTLDVSIAGFTCRVDHAATDFLESLRD
ncbi:MAG: hypothetical protein HYV96_21130 [Opitutae bacterium]|nr:hypothetical protein [Opitutae bacterium]